MFSGAGDAFSRRRWPISTTSSSICISVPSLCSSYCVLLCSRSRFLSIGAPMVTSWPKVSSMPLLYGDSRLVNLCLTSFRPPHFGVRSVSSNRRSVYFILPLSLSLRLEDPHQHSPSISSRAHPQTTTSDVLTDVSGIPHKTRFLDPNLFQFKVMCSPSFTLLQPSMKTFSTDVTSTFVLPPSITPSIPESRLSTDASPPLGSHPIGRFVGRRRAIELGPVLNVGLASLLGFRDHHLQLISQPTLRWGGLVSLANPLKMLDGFTGLFTEIVFRSLEYLSFSKSLFCRKILVDSPGPTLLPRLLSMIGDVSSGPFSSVRFNLFTGLLPCVAVCTGPEGAIEITLGSLVGEGWLSTSLVTKSQPSNLVEKTLSTHLSFVLNSQSTSYEDLSCFLYYAIVAYALFQRGCLIPSCLCNP